MDHFICKHGNYGECELCGDIKPLSSHAVLQEEIMDYKNEIERAFDILELYGVPKERAVTVSNGIDVLSTRYRKELAMCEANSNAVLADVRAWVEENKYSHGAFGLEVINVDDLLEYISEHFS